MQHGSGGDVPERLLLIKIYKCFNLGGSGTVRITGAFVADGKSKFSPIIAETEIADYEVECFLYDYE